MEIRETISEKIDGCNLLCNEKYESSKSPVKVIEWGEIICRVGMRCSEIREVFRGERENLRYVNEA